jgi:hypothetical protein
MDGRTHHPCSSARPKERGQGATNHHRRHATQCAVTSWTRAHVANMSSLIALRHYPPRQQRNFPDNNLCDRSLRRPMRRDATNAAADWGGTRRTIPHLQARIGGAMDQLRLATTLCARFDVPSKVTAVFQDNWSNQSSTSYTTANGWLSIFRPLSSRSYLCSTRATSLEDRHGMVLLRQKPVRVSAASASCIYGVQIRKKTNG